ncbi:MAG: peptidase S41, partial [Gemmatimonadota bacterium]|nr:peptidase S41 [Gemmatimonadota bacterium]
MYSQSCPARRTIHLKIMTAAFLLFFCMLPSTMQGQARWGTPFLRHPAPSPDGSRIALSCGGDIWIVSGTGVTARRITIHEAYDAHPVWSPAGDLIAFTSNRLGKNNIFVVDTLGMAVTQLTFRGAGDRPVDWSADGSDVVFTSLRDFSPRRIPTPYRVPSDGSRMPSKLWPVLASDVRVSPEGDKIAFSQGYQRWWRKGYTGSGNFDLWLYLPHSDSYRRLTGLAASEHTPMWPAGGPFIYYVSEHSGTANIYRRALEAPPTEPGEAVTFFTEDGVRWARISAGGNLIAFERGTDIFTLSLDPGAEPQLLRVALPADIRRNTLEWKSFSKGAESFSVSPDGSQAAVVVRGELFCVENLDDGYTNRIAEQGKETSRESAPRWLPDSTRLLFVSDRAGSAEDVYLVESADTSRKKLYQCLEFKLTRLTDGKMREHSPVPSPDGRTIAYIRGNGDLMLMNADGTDKRPLVTGWNMDHICWSPDSRWIAFSRNDIEFNQDVWLVAADRSREPVNVSMHPDIDNSPMFSADGRKLAFLSRRNHDNLDLYFVFLRRTDHELSVQERRWRAEEEAEKEKKKKGEKHEPSAIVIDFTDIHKRLRRVTSLTTDVQGFTLSPDGKTFAFSADMDGNSDLYKISWEGKDLTRLTTGGQGPGQLEYSPDGKKIYYLGKGGVPSELTVSSKKTRSLPLSARIRIDYRAERVHVFEEAWRTLNDNFYDPAFHGADWPAMREKYLPAMSSEKNFCAREDFDDLVRLMIGELNASHLGISPPGDGLPDVPVGALGVLLDESYPGPGFKVERVLKNGPADLPESRLYPNDVIVAVEGRQVQPGDNLFHLLYDKVDRQVSLEVR